MKTLLLAPHLDDACLSSGQFLTNQPGCDVITVFAGIPDLPTAVTPYDKKCGFKTSVEAMNSRRHEDQDALARLRCNPIHWDYLDSQYTDDQNLSGLSIQIVEVAKDYDVVLSCLGITHPDHRALSDAVLKAAESIAAPIYLWEDLPNRVLYPEAVHERLEEIGNLELDVPGGAGPMADKIRALLCYRSQLGTGDLDFNLLCVPERFWKVGKGW